MGALAWVVGGLVVGALGYFQAALALLDAPDFMAAWLLAGVGLVLAAVGARSLPDLGPLAAVGFLVATLANAFGLSLLLTDVGFVLATGAALAGCGIMTFVAWRGWREAELSSGDLRLARIGLGVAGLAGATYFVFELAQGTYEFLVGDVLIAVGPWLAAWKLGDAAGRAEG